MSGDLSISGIEIPLTLTVTAGAAISVNPASLSFTCQAGGSSPPTQSVQVSASGNAAVSFTAAMFGAPYYFFVDPKAGTTPATLVVSIQQAGLAPGTYSATLDITPTADGNPQTHIPVSLTVTPPAISASPASLTFAYQPGGSPPSSRSIQLSASGNAVVPFTAAASSDGNWLSVAPASGNTPAALTVSISPAGLALGTYYGGISVNGVVPIAVSLVVASAPLPTIAAAVNAASYSSGTVSPGEIVTLGGTGLGPADGLGLTLDPNGNVATSLGGVTVSFNGFLAPLVYVSATQINCVVPYELAQATSPWVQVSYAGRTSNAYTLSPALAAPGIFTLDGSGRGQATAVNGSGGFNGSGNPASQGNTIVIYLTGEGQTLPAGVTGKVTTVSTASSGPLTPQPVQPLVVTVGGRPAAVTFFGEAPGMVSGAMQINALIPDGLPAGNLPLTVSLGGVNSQSGVTVAVQ
jgi:uncharacterized protein (TIGR03437 family)